LSNDASLSVAVTGGWDRVNGRYSKGDTPSANTGKFVLFKPGNVNTLTGGVQ